MLHRTEIENDVTHTDTKPTPYHDIDNKTSNSTFLNIEIMETPPTAAITPFADHDPMDDLSSEDEFHSGTFFKFKKKVTNKRKATFCCIFSVGALILSIILLSAPLSSQMFHDYRLYHTSTRTRCTIISITNITGNHSNMNTIISNGSYAENVNTPSSQCYYIYRTADEHPLSVECGSTMHETAPCDTQSSIDSDNECYFFDDNECDGTMLYTSTLRRDKNVFVLLLGIGVGFAVITIMTTMYAVYLMCESGIYCSVHSMQMDDEKMFQLMQRVQKGKRKRKRKRHKRKHKSKSKSKRKRKSRKHRQLFEYEPTDDDFSSIFSSQFGSSTIPSGCSAHSIVSCDIDDVHVDEDGS